MRHFCTYFDHHFLLHGLTMYRSLREHAGPFRLHVLCFDRQTHAVLSGLGRDDLRPIALEEFERGDDALVRSKADRNRVEYYFTCTPSLPLYVLARNEGIDSVAYLDADLYFFSGPQPLYDELGHGSVLIIGHRFAEADRERGERFGIYNVGFLVFRNDAAGQACLRDWRERCIEWCRDIVEQERYADQKYLNRWPGRFPEVVVAEHKGANLARWNCMNYDLQLRNGSISVDGQPLIFYHYNGVRIVKRWLYDVDFDDYRIKETLAPEVLRLLYGTYIGELKKTWDWIGNQTPGPHLGPASARSGPASWMNVVSRMLRRGLIFAPGRHLLY